MEKESWFGGSEVAEQKGVSTRWNVASAAVVLTGRNQLERLIWRAGTRCKSKVGRVIFLCRWNHIVWDGKRVCLLFVLAIFKQCDWLSEGETVPEFFGFISGPHQVRSSETLFVIDPWNVSLCCHMLCAQKTLSCCSVFFSCRENGSLSPLPNIFWSVAFLKSWIMNILRDQFFAGIFRKLWIKFLRRLDTCVCCCSSLRVVQTAGWKPPGLPAETLKKNWVSAIHTGMEVRSSTCVECGGRMKMSIEGACRSVTSLERSRRLKLAWKTWTWKSSLSAAICFYSLLSCYTHTGTHILFTISSRL